jgi:hypothetical protein
MASSLLQVPCSTSGMLVENRPGGVESSEELSPLRVTQVTERRHHPSVSGVHLGTAKRVYTYEQLSSRDGQKPPPPQTSLCGRPYGL